MEYNKNKKGNDEDFGLDPMTSASARERAKAMSALEAMKRLEAERRHEMKAYRVGTCLVYSKDGTRAEAIASHQRSSWAELGFRQSKMKLDTPAH